MKARCIFLISALLSNTRLFSASQDEKTVYLPILSTNNLTLRPSVTGENKPFLKLCKSCLKNDEVCWFCEAMAIIKGKINRLKIRNGQTAPWVVISAAGDVLGLCGFDSLDLKKNTANVVVEMRTEETALVREAIVAVVRYAFEVRQMMILNIFFQGGVLDVLDGLGLDFLGQNRYCLFKEKFEKPIGLTTPQREDWDW